MHIHCPEDRLQKTPLVKRRRGHEKYVDSRSIYKYKCIEDIHSSVKDRHGRMQTRIFFLLFSFSTLLLKLEFQDDYFVYHHQLNFKCCCYHYYGGNDDGDGDYNDDDHDHN